MPTIRFFLQSATLLLLTPLAATRTNAQIGRRDDAEYRKNSAEFRQDIWSEKLPAFENKTVPPEFAKASKVILARHVELLADSKRRGPSRQLDITYISRELIKLNDATAVKEYSSFSYTAQKKNWYSSNSSASYLGVRVIKPDGQVKDVDLDEVILTKDDSREK